MTFRPSILFTMSRFLAFVFIFMCIVSHAGASDLNSASLQSLFRQHCWFELRAAGKAGRLPLFYKGAVEANFNEVELAENDLHDFIKAHPHSAEAYQAHQLLADLYVRTGKYQSVVNEAKEMLALRPSDKDVADTLSLFAPLESVPDQGITQAAASTVTASLEDGNVYLPVTVNGVSANYVADSGANLSTISQSEATRLQLEILTTDAKLQGITGQKINFSLAVAHEIRLGTATLKNVVFIVVADTQEPFVELPAGKRAILGLPVLLALKTISWKPDGEFSFGEPVLATGTNAPNLCFDGNFVATRVNVSGSSIYMILDTGATHTVLWPKFAKHFSHLILTDGKSESHKMTGVDGTKNIESVVIPSLHVEVGGFPVELKPAHVLLQTTTGPSDYYGGNLGIDLLKEGHKITLDFSSMMLVLQ
jgi:predicted aspartyl protease